jgi:hypothetical protein
LRECGSWRDAQLACQFLRPRIRVIASGPDLCKLRDGHVRRIKFTESGEHCLQLAVERIPAILERTKNGDASAIDCAEAEITLGKTAWIIR